MLSEGKGEVPVGYGYLKWPISWKDLQNALCRKDEYPAGLSHGLCCQNLDSQKEISCRKDRQSDQMTDLGPVHHPGSALTPHS